MKAKLDADDHECSPTEKYPGLWTYVPDISRTHNLIGLITTQTVRDSLCTLNLMGVMGKALNSKFQKTWITRIKPPYHNLCQIHCADPRFCATIDYSPRTTI